MVQQVFEAHPVQVAPDVESAACLKAKEFAHLVLLKLLDIGLALLLLCTSHLIADLDDAVDEEDEEKHKDEDGEVGEGNRG